MFRSIRARLTIAFVILLLLFTIVSGFFLDSFSEDFIVDIKKNNVRENAKFIKETTNLFYDRKGDRDLQEVLEKTMQSLVKNTNTEVCIIDNTGRVFLYNQDAISRLNLKEEDGQFFFRDRRQYEEIFKVYGEQFIETIGDFYGLFPSDKWYMIQTPLQGDLALCVFSEISEVNVMRGIILKMFIISSIIAFIVGGIIIYIIASGITNPLKVLQRKVNKIADGIYDDDVVVSGSKEIEQLSKSVNQMIVDLRDLEQTRKGFIADVSHELRTPITTISGFLEGMIDGTVPEDKKGHYLGIVREEVEKLKKLITDLLDLTKLEAKGQVFKREYFNINDAMRKAVVSFEKQIIDKKISVVAKYEKDPILVKADRDAIERVIVNLINNAIKFIDVGGKIELTTRVDKYNAYVSVSDNGIGMTEEEIKKIWDRFYKADSSRDRNMEGAGLGLSIVKNILEGHNREIAVASEKDIGTTFSFGLDLYEV